MIIFLCWISVAIASWPAFYLGLFHLIKSDFGSWDNVDRGFCSVLTTLLVCFWPIIWPVVLARKVILRALLFLEEGPELPADVHQHH